MNFRTTAIVFGLVTLVVAALFITALIDSSEEDPARTGELGLVRSLNSAGVKPGEVDTVEIVRTEPVEEELVFVKVGEGKWKLTKPTEAKVDSWTVEQIVTDLFRARPIAHPELTGNLAIHGLDKPSVKVTLRKGSEKSATVNIGHTTIGGERAVTFVTTSDAPKRPLAVRRSDLNSLFRDPSRASDGPAWQLVKWLPDYRSRKLIGSEVRDVLTEVESVKVTTGGKELALTKPVGGDWTFVSPAGLGTADAEGDPEARPNTAPFTGVRPLLNFLTALQAGGPEDYIERPEDLGKYGLAPNDPNIIRVELKPRNGPVEVLYLGKPVEENGKPVVPARVYARLEGDSSVIKVQTDRVEALRQTVANPAELRNRDLIPPSKRSQIDAIDLTLGPNTIKLRKQSGASEADSRWVLYGSPYDPTPAKSGEVEALLTALSRPRAAREVLTGAQDAAFTDAEKKATVKVWISGIDKAEKTEPGKPAPEPKLKGEPVELIFGKKEADLVFVRKITGGARVDLKVPESVLGLVTRSRLEYVDPQLKGFATTLATRVAFNRGAEPYEFEKREGAAEGWVFVKPDARKGQSADAQKIAALLGLLAGLFPERVVSENPSPEDLKRWGLDPAAPRMRVTVTLRDDANKERVYLFGNEAEDRQFVFAMQLGKPGERAMVVLARKSVVDRFASDDLRDPTIYRLDPSQVTRVKIKGWKGLLGPNPLEYLLEKRGAEWVAVSPPTPAGFMPDQAKVNALLTNLAAPRAEAFVAVGGRPEHGVDVNTAAEALEFTLESRDPKAQPTVTLVLGKPADGGKVFAASSAVPGEVFTLNAETIRKLTEKPASLQK